MTWSPQAFGMYTGKFDEGVHLLSRGSIKVRVRMDHFSNVKINMFFNPLNFIYPLLIQLVFPES